MTSELAANTVKQPRWADWMTKFLIATPGLISLAGSFGSLQTIAKDFSNSAHNLSLFNNGIAWLAILWFALGWFTFNWVENALQDKRIKLAGILLLFFFFELTSGIWLFQGLFEFGELQRFFSTSPQLLFSGACLRYSMFRRENFLMLSQVFSLRRYNSTRQRTDP